MHKDFVPPVSIEEFAAYLDGNLSQDDMRIFEELSNKDSTLKSMLNISDTIDHDMQNYVNDDFLYESDMSMLNEIDFELPKFDKAHEDSCYGDMHHINDGGSELIINSESDNAHSSWEKTLFTDREVPNDIERNDCYENSIGHEEYLNSSIDKVGYEDDANLSNFDFLSPDS